jgi:TldD protein
MMRTVLDEEIVATLLREALATGGRFAEVFAESRVSTTIRLDDGRIEEVVSGLDRGAGVRVFHGGSQAYAYTNRLDPASLVEAARVASGAVRGAEIVAPVVADLRRTDVLTHAVPRPAHDIPRAVKVTWLREADEAARAVDGAVRQVTVSYLDTQQRVLIANSEGLWVEEARPRIRLFVHAVAARDGAIQTGYEGPAGLGGAELLERHPPAASGDVAGRMAVAMLAGRAAPAGEMPVVIGPGGGGVLFHEACGHGLEADHVQKEASVFRGRLGDRIASPLVTGVDDGGVEAAWGSSAVDDEGTASHRTVLFDEGRLVNYLYDLTRARTDGVPSTGNGRRQSYASLPIPRMTNSYILAGDADAAAVVADTREGFYAKALGGGQVNPATGDFVFGVAEGYLIEGGRITAPVRGANLIGNGPAILAAIDAVSDDFETRDGICGKEGQGVPVSNGSPTLRIARMTVGGTDA